MKRIVALFICFVMIFSFASALKSASYKLGDVNNDGKINSKDAYFLRKRIAGLPGEIVEAASDINGDGQISNADVLLLRRHFVREVTIDLVPISDSYIAEMYISGVNIRNYNIVIPDEADVFTTYAAELLQDYIDDKTGIELPIISDAEQETTYEFLIGDTNRAESVSASAITLADDEYLLKKDGSKIIMQGNSYMVGGGVGKFTYDYISYDSSKRAQICSINDLPTTNDPLPYTPLEAKNVIFMIGDGMGPNHPAYTLPYNLNKGLEPSYTEFSADRLPHIGFVTTYSVTTTQSGGTTPTDSSAAGTALACGYKSVNHYVGLDSNKIPRQNLRELAVSLGKRNAVITTELKEGATPACFTVHTIERTAYNVIAELQSQITDCDYLKGDANDDLLKETKYALDILSTNNDAGFFTMIEEANIDTAGHQNDRFLLIHTMARLNSAVQYAMVFAVSHPDTLLLITADHETGGVKNGAVFTTKSHTTMNVKIYSIGSGSENYTGTIDNIYIPKVIAAGWGVNNFGQ